MFCPLCEAEYREGFTRCAECDAELVPQLDAPPELDAPEIAWRGGDPVAFSRVCDALTEAGIRFHVQTSYRHLAFELGMPRPFYNVWVGASDLTAALALAGPIIDPLAFALSSRESTPPAGEDEGDDSPAPPSDAGPDEPGRSG